MSHTYALLDVSCEAYQEIRRALVEAKYEYKIEGDEAGEVIDMHGIALSELEPTMPTPGTYTALKISCSCSGPEVGLETASYLSHCDASDNTPTVELMCGYCGSAILIVRHATTPDEYFRKAGREPEKGHP